MVTVWHLRESLFWSITFSSLLVVFFSYFTDLISPSWYDRMGEGSLRCWIRKSRSHCSSSLDWANRIIQPVYYLPSHLTEMSWWDALRCLLGCSTDPSVQMLTSGSGRFCRSSMAFVFRSSSSSFRWQLVMWKDSSGTGS